MPFPTAAFAVFFLAAFTLNWLLRPHGLLWRATMVAVSLYFCAWVDVRFALLIVGSAVVNGVVATAAARALQFGEPTPASRRWVATAVVIDVGVLALFAYHGFFLDSVTDVLGAFGLSATEPTLGLLVPVGLSIVTLHAISYVVDVGRGDVEPVAWGDLLLYLSFFPHLVAGPPVRVDELVPQFHDRPDPRRVPATDAFVLVGVGLFKAVVVAGYLGSELVDPAFSDPGAASGWALAAALYAFAVQIYAGFSGLTDIAVGCALLLGVEYPRPFDAPYTAPVGARVLGPLEHAGVPLAARLRVRPTRRQPARHGLHLPEPRAHHGHRRPWYGAGWPFVVWGALHGAYLVGERVVAARSSGQPGSQPPEGMPATRTGAVLRWALTFHLVVVAWVFYRADSVGAGFEVLGRIVTVAPGDVDVVPALAIVLVVAAVAAQFVPPGVTLGLRARFTTLAPAAQVVVLALVLTLVSAMGPDGALPYTYLPF